MHKACCVKVFNFPIRITIYKVIGTLFNLTQNVKFTLRRYINKYMKFFIEIMTVYTIFRYKNSRDLWLDVKCHIDI